jgi:hypothetical protein
MTTKRFDLSNVSVMIATPVHGQFPAQTTVAFVDTAILLRDKGVSFELKVQLGCSIIQQARNYLADAFLQSQATHLFMIDADMAWEASDFLKVLALATVMPAVAAAYPVKEDTETWVICNNGDCAANEYGCLPVDGLGLGFACVQRQVIEDLAAGAPLLRYAGREHQVHEVFRTGELRGYFLGEDIAFWHDAQQLGHQLWLEPHVRLRHLGIKEYSGDLLAALDKMKKPALALA